MWVLRQAGTCTRHSGAGEKVRNEKERKKEKDRERYSHRTLGDLKTPVPQPCERGAPWPKAITLPSV